MSEHYDEWGEARKYGSYSFVTFIHAAHEEQAQELASKFLCEQEAKKLRSSLGNMLVGMRRFLRPEKYPDIGRQLNNIAHHELIGNLALAYTEMDSGLLEPWDGEDLTRVIARNIVNGNYELYGGGEIRIEDKNFFSHGGFDAH